ncbi:hypothetical protein Tco_0360345, partial [Tanacetum coccineum]
VDNEPKTEKVIEENNDAAVSVEVDDQNEENMKEKEVQTEKEKQTKIEKVEHNQGNNDQRYDHLTQENFWEREFSEENFDKLVIEAAEDFKMRTNMTRSKRKPMRPLTFSLCMGLSPLKTTIKAPTELDEVMITDSLFSMQGDPYEFLFETKSGAVTIRDNMQTLAPQLKVEANVINSFVAVLNHKEMTKDILEWKKDDGKEDEDKQYEAFCKNMDNEFQNDDDLSKKEHIELGTSVIIDNSKSPNSYDTKYKKVCDLLSAKNWNLGFPTEEQGQVHDMTKMRVKFAMKMLMHEINIHREKMSEEAHAFEKEHTDKKLKQNFIMCQ